MNGKTAELVVIELKKKNGPQITILEALAMTKVQTNGYDIYVIQKDDVSFMAWIREDGSVVVKTQCW